MSDLVLEQLNILMVMPSRVQGAVLQKELGDQGVMNMACCANIQQALQLMREQQPDLVISSMYFEDGDGIDLVTAMRNEEALENILFMLVSSEERFDMLDPIRQAGVIAILPKPFDRRALKQALMNSIGFLNDDLAVDKRAIADLRVLVVDDSKLARRHIATVLGKIGVQETQVLQAENGKHAVELLEQQAFDVVFTDYNMPQMDGEELLKYIRQHATLQDTPVIMVTSERNETKIGSIQNHGVTAMLDKPFDAPHVKKLLEAQV